MSQLYLDVSVFKIGEAVRKTRYFPIIKKSRRIGGNANSIIFWPTLALVI